MVKKAKLHCQPSEEKQRKNTQPSTKNKKTQTKKAQNNPRNRSKLDLTARLCKETINSYQTKEFTLSLIHI